MANIEKPVRELEKGLHSSSGSASHNASASNHDGRPAAVDDGWNILRHSRAGILIMLIICGGAAGALTYTFSARIQDESFDLQVS